MNNCYSEALKLDVSILEALLRRNRCSHAKAKYFQRTSMALRAILRSNVIDLMPAITEWKKQHLLLMNDKNNPKKRQRTDGSVLFWDKNSLQKELDDPSIPAQIQVTLRKDLPEILSRIEFASQPLFLEICRGYFLPFCTICLAALARIRTVLMRMAHQVMNVLESVEGNVQVATLLKDMDMTALRAQFTEPANIRKEASSELKPKPEGAQNTRPIMELDDETAKEAHAAIQAEAKGNNDDDDIGQAVLSIDASDEPTAAFGGDKSKALIASGTIEGKTSAKDKDTRAKKRKKDGEQLTLKKQKKRSSKDALNSKKETKGRQNKDFFDDLFD
jgi:hypothetical protein